MIAPETASRLGAALRRLLTGSAGRSSERAKPTPSADDYGLLRAIAVVADLDTAHSIRALLAASRVRATVTTGRDGSARVLVFPDEYDRAHRLVGWVL
jgi:hypothetical protein